MDGARGQTREFVTVGLQQTYYSQPAVRAGTTAPIRAPTATAGRLDLSPVALTARVVADADDRRATSGSNTTSSRQRPADRCRPAARVERRGGVGWRQLQPQPLDPRRSEQLRLSATTSLRWLDGRATGTYALSWDIAPVVRRAARASWLSYLAQCCGLQVEFQKFNYARARRRISRSRRTRGSTSGSSSPASARSRTSSAPSAASGKET